MRKKDDKLGNKPRKERKGKGEKEGQNWKEDVNSFAKEVHILAWVRARKRKKRCVTEKDNKINKNNFRIYPRPYLEH